MQRSALLLGSGVSSSAGMPSTGKLTERVLSGAGVRRHPDGAYYFDARQSDAPADGSVARIRRFLHRLKAEIDGYYRGQPEHRTDYEDLYYAASQIQDSELREFDNPAVQPFIDKIRADIEPMLATDAGAPAYSLLELSCEATHYIRDVVWRLLCAEPSQADHMESLSAACLDNALSGVDIFTFNHDTVLEQLLSRNRIRVTDGFDEPVERIRYWNPDLFMRPDARGRLFKLHGSVNWFRLRPPDGVGELISMPLDWDFRHGEPIPDRAWPTGGRPPLPGRHLQQDPAVHQQHLRRSALPVPLRAARSRAPTGLRLQLRRQGHQRPHHRVDALRAGRAPLGGPSPAGGTQEQSAPPHRALLGRVAEPGPPDSYRQGHRGTLLAGDQGAAANSRASAATAGPPQAAGRCGRRPRRPCGRSRDRRS